jgi:uncharacterized protein with HEPN domain
MTRRESEWLSDIISWGERLQNHLSDVDRHAFFASMLIQDAACKCVEAIGEAAGKSIPLQSMGIAAIFGEWRITRC